MVHVNPRNEQETYPMAYLMAKAIEKTNNVGTKIRFGTCIRHVSPTCCKGYASKNINTWPSHDIANVPTAQYKSMIPKLVSAFGDPSISCHRPRAPPYRAGRLPLEGAKAQNRQLKSGHLARGHRAGPLRYSASSLLERCPAQRRER